MTKVKSLALLVGIALLFILPATVSAQRLPAHGFAGSVTLDGAPAPDGTTVAAWIGEAEVTSTTAMNGRYKLVVDQMDMAYTGETVTFSVDGNLAGESSTWMSGRVESLDLTASSPPPPPPPTGMPGSMGDRGDTGPKGDTGDTGAKGDTGDTGARGLKGNRGDAGDPGAKGDAGDSGAKGDTGAAGTMGAKGDAGTAGAKGDTGAAGATGNTGNTGPPGATGASGSNVLGIVALILAIVAIVGGAGLVFWMGRGKG